MNETEAWAFLRAYVQEFGTGGETLLDLNYPEQCRFVLDQATSIAAQCTRRAGKSHGLALRLYRAALRWPNSIPLYIALTRSSAKNIMWPVMSEINRQYRLGAEMIESSLQIRLPNESTISLVGADMKNFIERLRGPKYPEVCIDEAGSFRGHLKSLIEDILEPATLDYNGAIVLAGTPGVVPDGVFYDATTKADKGWSVHKWSLYQNPYLPNAKAFVESLKLKRGWTDANPTFLREYMGEWVIDRDALVYKFNREKNTTDALPSGHRFYRVMAIDYGWNDQTAFGIVSYSPTLNDVFVEHVEGHAEITPSEIAIRVSQLRDRFSPVRIVADTGGLGKSITEEMIRRYSLPIHPAEKTEKLTNIALMNGDFIDQRLWVLDQYTNLMDQYTSLTKDDDHKEDPSLPNDLCDAVLYAYREAKHYLSKYQEPDPKPGDPQFANFEAKKMIEKELEQLEEKEREWWEM